MQVLFKYFESLFSVVNINVTLCVQLKKLNILTGGQG